MSIRYMEDLKQEFAGYNGKKLSQDILAGVSVCAVALPLALAVGASSGLSAAAGLITAIIAGIIIGALSGASYQVSGTGGSMIGIMTILAYEYGPQGIFVACLLSGIMLLLAGFFKLGRVIEFIPAPVITGFTSGIAVIIAFGEFDGFIGTNITGDNVFLQAGNLIHSIIQQSITPNPYAFILGLLVLCLIIFWPPQWSKKLPPSLIGIILAWAICHFGNLSVPTIGEIPESIVLSEHLELGEINFSLIRNLLTPAFSIAILVMLESLMCGIAGGRMKGEKLNADRELLAHGVGNIILPFLGGIPATAGLARTSMAINSGGQTRLTTIFHGIGLLFCMFVLNQFMAEIPMSALSAILIMVGVRMNDWTTIKYIFQKRIPSAIASYFITLLTTVIFGLSMAIIIGLLLSSFFFILRVANIDIHIADINYEKLKEHGINIVDEQKKIKVIYLSGPIFFAAIDKINKAFAKIEPQDLIIFSMRGVPLIDTSGGQALYDLCQSYLDQGVQIMFSGVQPKVMEMFRIDGILDLVQEENFFWDTGKAMNAYEKYLLKQKNKTN